MVRLASDDGPDLLCLQEIPAWALEKLEAWSRMHAYPALAAPPRIGPLPSTALFGQRLTSLHHGVLRSAFSGQGNAILVAPRLRAGEREHLVLNPGAFRRAQAEWLGLGRTARLVWAKERRICQALRIGLEDGETIVVANLHATSYRGDPRLADAELLRAASFVVDFAEPDEAVALCGDFNLTRMTSRTLRDLRTSEWGFSQPGEGIDHVLVRGRTAAPEQRWPVERRRLAGRLLSDHAPVELTIT